MSLRMMMNHHNPITRHVSEHQVYYGTSNVHYHIYRHLQVCVEMDDNYWEILVPEETRVETVSVEVPTFDLLMGSFDSFPCLVCKSSLLSGRTISSEALHGSITHEYYSRAAVIARRLWLLLNTEERNYGMSIPHYVTALDIQRVSYLGYEEIIRRTLEESRASEMFRPATQSSIEALERGKFCGSEDEKCSVCLEEFELGVEVFRLPCFHFYHGDCIVPWLEKSHMCPLCRFPLPHHQY
ncbi:hypothetical protein Patl1_17844 [Pistacia atlantica]|uniref:Uncharacterized protein n=1 Tax=Pistacia atlantica TaxID=434234 RepID=A0ACC1BZB9_9ROSI|nr:hypothetical protein Patl1_17844 [Pistacia atlantica]